MSSHSPIPSSSSTPATAPATTTALRVVTEYGHATALALRDRFSAETVAGGLATAAAGAAAAAAVSASFFLLSSAIDSVRRRTSTRFVVQKRSRVFAWLTVWMSAQPEFAANGQKVAVQLQSELDPGLSSAAGAGGGGGGGEGVGKSCSGKCSSLSSSSSLTSAPPGSLRPLQLGYSLCPTDHPTALHQFRFRGALVSCELRQERIPGQQKAEESLRVTVADGSPASAVLFSSQSAAAARRRQVLEALVAEARGHYEAKTRGRTEIFIGQGEYGSWDSIGTRRARSLASVILPEGLAESMLRDALRFKGAEKWYADRGIPYRRGYLLHGTPGSGKTSLITAIAGELNLDIFILNLSNASLDDSKLIELMAEVPSESVVVLEDVDAAFQQRTRVMGGGASGGSGGGGTGTGSSGIGIGGGASGTAITFAGLLNAIDGVAAQEGRILCLTTNHVENLDPALIRPGRVDMAVEFGHAERQQVRRLFLQFYAQEEAEERGGDGKANGSRGGGAGTGTGGDAALEEQANAFAGRLEASGGSFSMAAVQGHLLVHSGAPEAALESVDALLAADGPPGRAGVGQGV